MSARIVKWNGDKLIADVKRAAAEAIDETTKEAARDAEGSHWWNSRTGRLEAQTVNEPAIDHINGVTGRFGTTERLGFYGLILERRIPFLRPAADRVFPKLAKRIAERID